MSKNRYMGFRPGVRTVVCESPVLLLEIVASELANRQDRSQLDSLGLIELGSVYVNDERSLNPAHQVQVSDQIRIHTDPRRFTPPSDLSARIISETEDSILVEKPAGLPSEPVVDNVKENLLSFLEDFRGQRFFLTHQLAAESKGLLLIAKTSHASTRITRAFAEGRVKRRYIAYAESPVPTSDASNGAIKTLSCQEQRGATNLITENRQTWILTGEPIAGFYRLEIEFMMARPQEVRAQLAACGAPIIGDRAHGSRYDLIDSETQKPAMAFHAVSLSVT